MKQYRKCAIAVATVLGLTSTAFAAQSSSGEQGANTPFSADHAAAGANYTVVMERIDVEKPYVIGEVKLSDSPDGLRIQPSLKNLTPGEHGFHVHTTPKCSPRLGEEKDPGSDAGPHYDPMETQSHKGPHADGHLGDLPLLTVDEQGRASERMVAPRLKLADVAGRALIIHEAGDNYADQPKPLGGGGKRIACGIIRN